MLKIACQRCGHIGLINAQTLPRELRCWQCGCSRRVERKDGARIVNRVAFEEWLLGAPGSPRVTERKLQVSLQGLLPTAEASGRWDFVGLLPGR
jgi:hypothetical protein